MNNYEKIKSMTIEEMAEFFYCCSDMSCNYCTAPQKCKGNQEECLKGHEQWLKQEAE